VSPEPEFYIKEREADGDEFLVLACDGVWDVMTNEDVVNFVSHRMRISDDLEHIANEVIDTCLHKGSRDNMSIIIIAFPAAPKVSQTAIKEENELNESIRAKVNELVKNCDEEIQFIDVFQKLSYLEEEFPNLPSGGGMFSKKALIEEIYNSHFPDKQVSSKDDPCPNPLASLLFSNANQSTQPSSSSAAAGENASSSESKENEQGNT